MCMSNPFLVCTFESHLCWGNMLSLFHCHAPCRCAHGLHHTLAPCPWLRALARVTTTPCSCLKPTPQTFLLLQWHHAMSYPLLVQQQVMTLHTWLLIHAQGIAPLCIASHIMSWVNFVVVASSYFIQATNHDRTLQAALHKACLMCLARVEGFALRPLGLVMPMPPWVTYSPLLP